MEDFPVSRRDLTESRQRELREEEGEEGEVEEVEVEEEEEKEEKEGERKRRRRSALTRQDEAQRGRTAGLRRRRKNSPRFR